MGRKVKLFALPMSRMTRRERGETVRGDAKSEVSVALGSLARNLMLFLPFS